MHNRDGIKVSTESSGLKQTFQNSPLIGHTHQILPPLFFHE